MQDSQLEVCHNDFCTNPFDIDIGNMKTPNPIISSRWAGRNPSPELVPNFKLMYDTFLSRWARMSSLLKDM